MNKFICFVVLAVVFPAPAIAQPPGAANERGFGPRRVGQRNSAAQQERKVSSALIKLLQYDADEDGNLTREELSDSRLQALFTRADKDSDDVLTKAELVAVVGGNPSSAPTRSAGEPTQRSGSPAVTDSKTSTVPLAVVIPDPLRDSLGLSQHQRDELARLQLEVDRKLKQILNAEQHSKAKQWTEERSRQAPASIQAR
ncbi:EF-hand domain-containing protein [Roseiconus lacunae]|uniref:hypothetical protein n=1 Tax=Roseiconus lacunae TaxID=2605694 RepID=UPI0011F27822|nr:hypothetical protein [Roseiconus lacunae]